VSLKTIALILCSVFLATAGQLLLKTGMTRVGYLDGSRLGRPLQLFSEVARTWQVVLGLTLFVLSAVSWLIVMSRVPLSFAYPFVGITYLLLQLFAKFVLHEHVPAVRWFGVALIVAGIIVVGRTTPAEPVPGGGGRQAVNSTTR
jgi:multidrug transporter EmrE-like cation transporter